MKPPSAFCTFLAFALLAAAAARAQNNDSFAGRLTLSGSTATAVSTNLRASREPGEPNHASGGGTRSLWWTWTAPTTGTVNFSAYAGGALPTGFYPSSAMPPRTLAVYTGDSLPTLSEVSSINTPDSSVYGYTYYSLTSGVVAGPSFNAQVTAGTVYQIAVSVPSYQGSLTGADDGTVILAINQLPCIYSAAGTRAAAGGPFTYSILASNNPSAYQAAHLPPGLSLNPATGEISGTPSSAGVYAINLAATNLGGTGTATLTLEVTAPGMTPSALAAPVVSSAATAGGIVGAAFTYSVYGSGGASTYEATGLPSGLSIDKTSGTIAGTPMAAGDYPVAVSVTNAAGTGRASVLFRFAAAARAPMITSNLAASGTVGSSFYYSVSTSDSSTLAKPTGYTASNLPPGFGFDTAAGTLRGTPTTAGLYPVPLSATNAAGTGSAVVTVTILAPSSPAAPPSVPPVLNSAATATAVAGTAFSHQLSASNAPTGFAAGSLPPGVSLNTQDGYLTGAPLTAGVYRVPVSAANAYGTCDATLTITVAAAASATVPSDPPPIVTSPAEVSTSVGGYVYYQVTATYGSGSYYYGYSSSVTVGVSNLPPGLSFNPTYGQITGTPTRAGTYQSRIGVTAPSSPDYYPTQYATGTATVTFVVDAAAPAPAPTVPVFSSAASVAGVQGVAFGGYTASASGSPTAYTADGLPPGLSFNASSHAVTGTPTAGGVYQTTFNATNAAGTGRAVATFVIAANAPPTPAPVINSSATAAATVGKSFSHTIYGSNSPTGFADRGLPPGLAVNTGTGSISGTPTTGGVFNVPVSATNAGGTANATLVLTIAAGPAAPVISSSATARGTLGVSFSYYVSASNSPTSYAASGLPDGLTLNATSGTISGTPTAAGVFTVPITATNATATAGATLTITVAAAPAAPVLSGNAAANAVVGGGFSYSLSATNSPTAYAASGLPDGLTLNATSGTISGTPTAAGVYPVAVSASNAGGAANATLTITVAASNPVRVPAITSVASATGLVGAAFSYAITATNAPTAYDLGAGTPPGLSFDPKTGTLAGTPTTAGKFPVPIYASNAAGNTRAVVTLVFTAQPTARPVITAPANLNAYAGQPFNFALTADNAPASFAASNLPPGLSLNATTGVLSGTPVYNYAEAYAVAVSASNAVGTGTATVTIQVVYGSAGSNVTSAMSVGGIRGTGLSYAITATGSPYSYAATGLPPGMTYSPGTGQISGTPNTAGTYTATVTAYASAGTATAKITFVIVSAATGAPLPSTSAGAVACAGDPFYYALAATNNPTGFTVGGLPSGLTYDAARKAITGTPTSAGSSSIAITATNAAGSGGGVLGLAVRSAVAPRVASPAAAGGQAGIAFNYAATVSANAYAYKFSAVNLPPGLTLESYTGRVTGTPTAAGVFTVPLTVSTSSGTVNASLTFVIDDLPTAPPVFAGAAQATGTIGAPLRYVLAASNQPTAFTASGLPAGLALDGAAGAISGVPTEAGTFSVPLSATNAAGTSAATLTFTIAATPAAPPDLGANGLAVAFTTGNTGVLYQAQAANGPSTFTASGLPPGLSLDPVSGAVSGVAGTPGTFAATVSATNAAGTSSVVVTFNVSAGRAPMFSSINANLPGTVGASFNSSIYASGPPSVSYAATGLPPGLYLDGGSGQFIGAPTASGMFTAMLSATNALGTDTAAVVFVVSMPVVPVFSGSSAEQTTNVGGSFYNSYYTSDAASYAVSGLPPGLSYSSSGSNVELRGTPTAAGVYPVTITASNAAGSASEVVTFVVSAPGVTPPSITSAAGAGGSVNAAFGYQIGANNSPTAYTASGWPDGLQLNTASGYISGTPAAIGTYSVAISAANAGGTANAVVTLQIDASPAPAPGVPVILSAAAAGSGSYSSSLFYYSTSSQTSRFSYAINASAAPTSFAASGLPLGLSLNATTGVISGVPQAAGTFLVPISATNSTGTGNAVLTIMTPLAAPVLQTALAASGAVDSPFYYLIGLANPAQPYETYYYWSGSTPAPDAPTFAATGLPPGLRLNRITGQIIGTPTQAGSFPVTLSAANRAGTGTAVVTVVIAATALPAVATPPTLSANATAPGFVGAPFSFNLSGNGTSYAASALPDGLLLNPSSGQIAGTPTAAGTYPVAVSRTNAAGTTASAVLTIMVFPSPDAPVISNSAGTSATVGASFSYSIRANTSTFVPAPISYGIENVPPGLSFNTSSGSLSGTPTQEGVFVLPISATSAGVTTQGTLTLTVRPAATTPPATSRPLLAGPAGAGGFLGNPFTYPARLAGFLPDGTLPDDLHYDPGAGSLTGVPTMAGSFDVALSATGSGGTGHAVLNLRFFAPDLSLPRFTEQPTVGSSARGSGITLSASATGTPAPAYQWMHDGLPVPGANGPTLDFAAVQPSDAGTYVLTAANTSGAVQSIAVALRVIETFADWQNNHFTAGEIATGTAAAGYDFDGDGWSNPLDYALGREPRNGAGSSVPMVSRLLGGTLAIQFNRDSGKTDLVYTVEASPGLRNWTALARSDAGAATANLGGAGAITENAVGSGNVTVTVQDGVATVMGGARFLRLRVTQP